MSRSVKNNDGCRLTPEELLLSMDYMIISSIGMAAKDLVSVLPSYECEKVTNTTDFSLHQESPQLSDYHHRNGGGFRISQSRALETKPILTQTDLRSMQDNNTMIIYNAKATHTWVARLVR